MGWFTLGVMADGFGFGLGFFLGILVVVVAVAAYEISQRLLGNAEVPSPVVDDSDVMAVLAALPQSHIIIDVDDAVVRASSITYAYGLVGNGQLRKELRNLAAEARAAGEVSALDLRLPRLDEDAPESVSYTHLTLPTNREV